MLRVARHPEGTEIKILRARERQPALRRASAIYAHSNAELRDRPGWR